MQWKNGRPKRELNCTMLRTSQRLCNKTTHSLPLLVIRKMRIVGLLVRAKVCVEARTTLVLQPLMVVVTKDLDPEVRRMTPEITCRLLLLWMADHIRTELRSPLLPPRSSRHMDREMLDMDTNSHRNRSGKMIDSPQRAVAVLANSHQCAMMLPIRPTVSQCQCLGRSRLHKSSRSTLTKHKLGNPLVALLYPRRW